MKYTLCYQTCYVNTVVVASSKSLLKLLKIKVVTYGSDFRAFVTNGETKEELNRFDLSSSDRIIFNNFEMKVNSGRYFPTYDYRQRAREHYLATL